jgi:hypothetical protein
MHFWIKHQMRRAQGDISGTWSVHGSRREEEDDLYKIRVMRKNFIDQGPWYDEEIIVAWE